MFALEDNEIRQTNDSNPIVDSSSRSVSHRQKDPLMNLILVIIIFCICFFGYNQFRPWLLPQAFVSGWSGHSNLTEGSTTQTVEFNATIKNNAHYPVFVRRVDSVFSDIARFRFLSGDETVQVGQWLKPGETTEIKGTWIFKAEGYEKKNIMTTGNYVSLQTVIYP